MAITAQDIENVSFSISKKGYDVDEVDVFLEHVATEIDNLNKLVATLQSNQGSPKAEKFDDNVQNANDKENNINEDNQVPEHGAINVDKDDIDVESAEQLRSIIDEKDRLIASLNEKLNSKTADDSAISQALIVAQKSADEIIANANSKADSTIEDANEEAGKIINRAEEEKEAIMKAIAELEENKEDSRNEYADLLRDLINDASSKLNSLGFQHNTASTFEMTGGNGSSNSEGGINEVSPVIDVSEEEEVLTNSSFVEKDMSGFGEIADDDDLD
jgi:cell division initiation protein